MFCTLSSWFGTLYQRQQLECLVDLFNKIMLHCDFSYNALQHRTVDCISFVLLHRLYQFQALKYQPNLCLLPKPLEILQNLTPKITHDATSEAEPCKKLGRLEIQKKVVAKEVCDVIMTEIDNRFNSLFYLSADKLFQPINFVSSIVQTMNMKPQLN